jgi:hypothetical protein
MPSSFIVPHLGGDSLSVVASRGGIVGAERRDDGTLGLTEEELQVEGHLDGPAGPEIDLRKRDRSGARAEATTQARAGDVSEPRRGLAFLDVVSARCDALEVELEGKMGLLTTAQLATGAVAESAPASELPGEILAAAEEGAVLTGADALTAETVPSTGLTRAIVCCRSIW